jgi:hypothetical protein
MFRIRERGNPYSIARFRIGRDRAGPLCYTSNPAGPDSSFSQAFSLRDQLMRWAF